MTSPRELPKGFFPVQTRVSKGRNPDLYEHLVREAQNGESPGAVIRRLAEEALMLRNHPLTRALQALDLKVESRTQFHTTPAAGLEQKSETFHNSTPPVSTAAPAKEPVKQAPKPPRTGAGQMASILVGRMPSPTANRG